MNFTKETRLKITGMNECGDTTARPHDEIPVVILEQGNDTIWLDADGARVLGIFLAAWATGKAETADLSPEPHP